MNLEYIKLADGRVVIAQMFNGKLVPLLFRNFKEAIAYRDKLDPSRNTLIVGSRAPYHINNVKLTHKIFYGDK